MEEFVKLKNSGNSKVQQQKFDSAISDFSSVINKLDATSVDEAQLKMICLINRSTCNLMLNKPQEALFDTNSAIKLYEEMTTKFGENEKLKQPLSLAFTKRGQIREACGEFSESVKDYKLANDEKSLSSLYRKLSIVPVKKDKYTEPFAKLYEIIDDKEASVEFFGQIFMNMAQNEHSKEEIESLKSNSVHKIVFGFMQLYMKEELQVVLSLSVAELLAEYGIDDVFNGFPVVITAMDEWKNNPSVIGEALKLLNMAPQKLYTHFAENGMIPALLNSLCDELSDDEIDISFLLLYKLAKTSEQIVEVANTNVVDVINKRRTIGALILLSKLSQVPQLVRDAQKDGAADWSLDLLEKHSTNPSVVSSAAIIIAQTFVHSDTAVVEENDETHKRAERTVLILNDIAQKSSKNPVIVSNAFAALASCAPFAKDVIKKKRCIQAGSAMLKLHIEDEAAVMNIVSFFFSCTQCGMSGDVKSVSAALPTTMSALQKHPSNQLLAERAVAVAVECGSSYAEDLVSLGLAQFPQSVILRKYVNKLKKQDN